jgi:HEAT repeat protein
MKQAKKSSARRTEDERWARDIAILRQAAQDLAQGRHKPQIGPFDQIAGLLDDPSPAVREKAVRDLYAINPDQAATLVNDALRDGSPEERRRIGSALADSGLLYEAIDDLMAENHEHCYSAFSLLFLVAKAGVVEPLSSIIEKHPSLDLSLAVIRLLASSGEPEVTSTLQRLALNDALPPELRSAAAESISRF